MAESIEPSVVSRENPLIVRPVGRFRPWLLGAVFWIALLPLTYQPRVCDNVLSRYMTIESLVMTGSLSVDVMMKRGVHSIDVVKFGPHFYSDKPPVFPALAALVYYPLYCAGLQMSRPPPRSDFVLANLALVWLIVGGASAVTVASVRLLLQAVAIPRWCSDLLAVAFAFGSLLLVYGVTFNNHSVAAALLTASLVLVIFERPFPADARGQRFIVGVMTGLAATIDIPAGGAWLVAFGVWMFWRSRTVPLWYVLGLIPPLLLHCGLQSSVTGSPLPVEAYPQAFDYAGSYWMTPSAQWKEPGPRWRFALEFLVGPQGWLTVTPVLGIGLLGLALTLVRRDDPLRPAAIAVAGTLATIVLYYVWGVRRTDYAGLSFGTRHMLAISPPLLMFAAAAVARMKNHFFCALFAITIVVGTFYAVAGVRDPWDRIERRVAVDQSLRILQRFVLYPWTSYGRFDAAPSP